MSANYPVYYQLRLVYLLTRDHFHFQFIWASKTVLNESFYNAIYNMSKIPPRILRVMSHRKVTRESLRLRELATVGLMKMFSDGQYFSLETKARLTLDFWGRWGFDKSNSNINISEDMHTHSVVTSQMWLSNTKICYRGRIFQFGNKFAICKNMEPTELIIGTNRGQDITRENNNCS